jgi:FixJ family two-component response regulator
MPARLIRVAILDDDASVRTAISRLLRTSAFGVDRYGTSAELFNALPTNPPDCLVLDLQMPGLNGIEVMQYLNRTKVQIPTVMITAHDELGVRESCLAAGARAYLRKPLDGDELLRAIAAAMASFKH